MSFFIIMAGGKLANAASKIDGRGLPTLANGRVDMGVVEDVGRLILLPYGILAGLMGWEPWADVIPCVRRKK